MRHADAQAFDGNLYQAETGVKIHVIASRVWYTAALLMQQLPNASCGC